MAQAETRYRGRWCGQPWEAHSQAPRKASTPWLCGPGTAIRTSAPLGWRADGAALLLSALHDSSTR
eukprot:2991224-Alexandrium_andersonii.AAC.1